MSWAAWRSHTRRTGRLDLEMQVSVGIPWGLGRYRERLGRCLLRICQKEGK